MKVKKRKSHRRKRRSYAKKKRRNPGVALMGNPRRRRRINPGFGKLNISKVLTTGVAAAGGAATTLFITNLVVKALQGSGKTLSVPMKNFVMLGTAIGLSAVIPKFKLGKFTEPAITGAIAIGVINIASTSLGAGKFFNLAGEDNPELDRIISNLNVSGGNVDLMGENIDLLGLTEDPGLLGIAETLNGADALMQEDEEYF